MLLKIILYLIFFSFTLFSKTYNVDCSTPYSSGILELYGDSLSFFNEGDSLNSFGDSIVFNAAASLYYRMLPRVKLVTSWNDIFLCYENIREIGYYDSLPLDNDQLHEEFAEINGGNGEWNDLSYLTLPNNYYSLDKYEGVADTIIGHYVYWSRYKTYYNGLARLIPDKLWIRDDYSAIIAFTDSLGNNYKIQFVQRGIDMGGGNIDTPPEFLITPRKNYAALRWAIDSCGNGIFKYDSTDVGISPQKITVTKNQTSQFKINIKNQTLSVASKQKTENLKIKVFDLMGRSLILSDGRERSLNISALSSGVYFAEVAGGVGAREVFKFSIR